MGSLFRCGSSGETTITFKYYYIDPIEEIEGVEYLSEPKSQMASTTVGDYVLFAGGNQTNSIDAYNSSLAKTVVSSPLKEKKDRFTATTVGDYAIFLGGNGGANSVDVYDSSLTKIMIDTLQVDMIDSASTTIGNYAVFAGTGQGTEQELATAIAYDNSLTKISISPLSVGRYSLRATTAGNYGLFAGGVVPLLYESNVDVDVYDRSLIKTIADPLTVGRNHFAATTVGNYALFGGGIVNRWDETDTVEGYDNKLIKTIVPSLSEKKYFFDATTNGDYAFFSGTSSHQDIDMYSNELTKIIILWGYTQPEDYIEAGSIGGYILFAGGGGYQTNTDTVTAFKVNKPYLELQVYPNSKYKLNSEEEIIAEDFMTLKLDYPVNGYVKLKNTIFK